MGTATVLIFVRCIYRAIEMSQGWSGALARNQDTFLIFESIFVWLAGVVLLVFHPGFAYVYMRQLNTRLRDSGGPMIDGVELEEGRGNVKGGLSSQSSS